MRTLRVREQIPAGIYRAKFDGIADTEGQGEYGPGLQWKFTITEGEYKNRQVSRTTATEPSQKNSCGKMLRGLGHPALTPGQEVSIEPFVGREYQVVIEPNSTGNGTRVGSVVPLKGEAKAELKQQDLTPPESVMHYRLDTDNGKIVTSHWVEAELEKDPVPEMRLRPVNGLGKPTGPWGTPADFGLLRKEVIPF
jgi:hypothetical protein